MCKMMVPDMYYTFSVQLISLYVIAIVSVDSIYNHLFI
jgi:hypothetical protein